MSISRNEFMKGTFKHRVNNNLEEHPVFIFLSKNGKRAYSVAEISKAVKMKHTTVRSVLRSMRKKGLVTHRTPYFISK